MFRKDLFVSKRFLSVREFASETGISVAMTYKNLESKRLRGIKQNGPLSNWLIPQTEISEWANRQRPRRRIKSQVGSSSNV